MTADVSKETIITNEEIARAIQAFRYIDLMWKVGKLDRLPMPVIRSFNEARKRK